jgi:hypothetical protein
LRELLRKAHSWITILWLIDWRSPLRYWRSYTIGHGRPVSLVLLVRIDGLLVIHLYLNLFNVEETYAWAFFICRIWWYIWIKW